MNQPPYRRNELDRLDRWAAGHGPAAIANDLHVLLTPNALRGDGIPQLVGVVEKSLAQSADPAGELGAVCELLAPSRGLYATDSTRAAFARMALRLVEHDDRFADAPGVAWPKVADLPFVASVGVREWVTAVRQLGGRYHSYFPLACEATNEGHVLQVEVIAILLSSPNDQVLPPLLHPGTEFVPDPQRFKEFQDAWASALKAFLSKAEREHFARLGFLVRFRAIEPGELNVLPDEDRRLAAWHLTPRRLEIGGASFGLATLLAAFAAGTNGSLYPIAATGTLSTTPDAELIASRCDLKASAAVQFARVTSGRSWRLLVPTSKAEETRGTIPNDAPLEVHGVASVKQLGTNRRSWFTDGFDGVRRLFGMRPPPGEQPFDADCLAHECARWLTSATRDGWFHVAQSHINRHPHTAACWLAHRVASQVKPRTSTMNADSPVVLPVSVHSLRDLRPEQQREQFIEWLVSAIKTGLSEVAPDADLGGLTPTKVDLEAALRRDRKLLLVAYDQSSQQLWNDAMRLPGQMPNSGPTKALCRLARPLALDWWKPQAVVFIASDAYHESWVRELFDNPNRARS